MYKFTIELADIPVEILARNEYCYIKSKEYLTDSIPEFTVSVTDEDIRFEQENGTTTIPEEQYMEWAAIYRKICSRLANKGIVLIHGSAIAVDGKAYLFCAKSGIGKSTHVRLWREYLGCRAIMINDDKPLVKVSDESIRIYGTPWNGKHHLGANTSAPLKAVCFLSRSKENHIEHIDKNTALSYLIKYTFRPDDPAATLDVLDAISKIADLSDFYTLGCNMDPSAAEIAYRRMSGL